MIAVKKKYSALKGQLTKLRKRFAESIPAEVHNKIVADLRKEISKMQKQIIESAEAQELVELLEWAKLRVSYRYYTGTDNYDIYPFCSSKNYRFENTSLLNALREAKKMLEGGK